MARAPKRMNLDRIDAFVLEKQDWILEKVAAAKQRMERQEAFLKAHPETPEQLKKQAAEIFPAKMEFFAQRIGVTYRKINIRNPKTRWGSCNSQGDIMLHCRLVQMPEEIQDYVIVHELCHRKHMNHSKEFWDLVRSVMPDYKIRRKWLKSQEI